MSIHERLLRRLIGRHKAAALLGDIREEAARIPDQSRLWFTRQILAALLAAAWIAALRKQARGRTSLQGALRDAVRSVRRFPGSTALAFGVVALSVAAATVTFSVVDTVVLRRLPFPEDDRLVAIYGSTLENPYDKFVSPPDYYAWRDGTRSFQALAAWSTGALTLPFGADLEDVGVASTTANLFEVLQVRPLVGRTYEAQHETAGTDNVVLIGYELWHRRFGADPAIVGRTLPMAGTAATIIGVMPREFRFPVDGGTGGGLAPARDSPRGPDHHARNRPEPLPRGDRPTARRCKPRAGAHGGGRGLEPNGLDLYRPLRQLARACRLPP